MDDMELTQARKRIARACDTLREVSATLRAAREEATTQPLAGHLDSAMDAIGRVCNELHAAGPGQLTPPVEKAMEKESLARAVSEVNSGEYDLQG